MVKRKQILKIGLDIDISLIGISCHLKFYRLSYAMDKNLGFDFRRINDFEIPGQENEPSLCYPFLIYEDSDFKNEFCLISNHHPQGKLVPSLRQVDFFLMSRNPIEKEMMTSILQKIRSISQVVAAYEINPLSTKDIDLLLEEMELHLLLAGKTDSKA